jgi:hypothetical protein
MIKLLENTMELQQIYTFNNSPSYPFEFAKNLGYKHGVSTWNDDYFNPYLNQLIEQGILTKEYDFIKDGYREAVYTFSNGSLIEFFGENHMTMRLFYNY